MALASVTTTFGNQVASHSDTRYQPFARAFHFLRFRSRPSTFSATGVPSTRGIQVKIALAALQYSTESNGVPSRWSVERNVCARVSKYLWRMVGRYCSRTLRYTGLAERSR